jgi:hypothetical protein
LECPAKVLKQAVLGDCGGWPVSSLYLLSYTHRKNPVHFREYSHEFPAAAEDDDAAGSDCEPSEPDKRPICPFGASCYRKNPAHHREFLHPAGMYKHPWPAWGNGELNRMRVESIKYTVGN